MKSSNVALGARIPLSLKRRLDRFCEENGIKMSFVVATALEDKLGELVEELKDRALVRERLENAKFISQKKYNEYMKRRIRVR